MALEERMKHEKKALLGALATVGAFSAIGANAGEREAQAINSAKLSLTDAIDIAQKQGNGMATDAEFDVERGSAARYEVKVLSSDGAKLTEYHLDANTGKVTRTDNEAFEKAFERLKPQDIQAAPISLSRAIATAEQRAGGKAIDAEIERSGDQVHYEITVASADGKTQEVNVSGQDGKVALAQ
jgi:uncharacterized membrane protein YkoI